MNPSAASTELPALDGLRRARAAGPWARAAGFAVVPAVLALACLGLWWHVRRQALDALERPHLTADAIRDRIVEHLVLTGLATAAAVVVAVPLGVLAGRLGRRTGRAILTLANVARAAPALGVLALFAIALGTEHLHMAAALAAVSALPVVRGTMVGVRRIDRRLMEAARGLGLSRAGAALRVTLPLALPAVLAGIRIAVALNVAGAALAAFAGAGGLGEVVRVGLRDERDVVILVGAVLLAAVALALDWAARVLEAVLRPRGL